MHVQLDPRGSVPAIQAIREQGVDAVAFPDCAREPQFGNLGRRQGQRCLGQEGWNGRQPTLDRVQPVLPREALVEHQRDQSECGFPGPEGWIGPLEMPARAFGTVNLQVGIGERAIDRIEIVPSEITQPRDRSPQVEVEAPHDVHALVQPVRRPIRQPIGVVRHAGERRVHRVQSIIIGQESVEERIGHAFSPRGRDTHRRSRNDCSTALMTS